MSSSGCWRRYLARFVEAASRAVGFLAEIMATCVDRELASETAGGGCSTMISVLVPPMPNALIPARLGVAPGHWMSSVGTKKGEFAKSIFGFGVLKWRLGGISPVLTHNEALINAATPDAVLRWPMFVFTDPSPQKFLRSVFVRNTR